MAAGGSSRRSRRRPHLDPLGGRMLPAGDGTAPPTHGRDVFEAALAAGARDGARPEDAGIVQALAEARVEGIGEVPYGSNAVFLVQLASPDPADPAQPMRAVYKPARGERPLWDFPRHTLYLREVATYLVAAALEMPYVPPTVLRDGPLGPGSMQLFVHALQRTPDAEMVEGLEHELRDVATLDVLVNNADRKTTHLMLTASQHVAAIDNALTFLPYPRQRTALIALGGTALPDAAATRVQHLAQTPRRRSALRRRLARLLSPHEVEAFMQRLTELAADPVYPRLDEWDGRPFEWW